MNIFCLQSDPISAAHINCDQHTVKIPLEICQMLACGFSLERLKSAPPRQDGKPRGHFNPKHCVTRWVLQSRDNWDWAILHAKELDAERMRRNGTPPHFAMGFLRWAEDHVSEVNFTGKTLTDFAVAIKQDKLCRKHPLFDKSSSVDKYRLYYANDKPFATWKQNKPSWLKDYSL